MSRAVALFSILFWPLIPMFWLPVHGLGERVRRLGRLVYLIAGIAWLPVAAAVLAWRDALLSPRFHLPTGLTALGWLLFATGSLLQIWTAVMLGRKIVGLPELLPEREEQAIEVRAPFSWCRHPTYLAHHLMFTGAALLSGSLSVAAVAVLDIVTTQIFIIPLEEKELAQRFGEKYLEYARKVPRILPSLSLRGRR